MMIAIALTVNPTVHTGTCAAARRPVARPAAPVPATTTEYCLHDPSGAFLGMIRALAIQPFIWTERAAVLSATALGDARCDRCHDPSGLLEGVVAYFTTPIASTRGAAHYSAVSSRRPSLADFYQTGVITTLHRLGETHLERLEAELVEFAEIRPLTLIIPALASELDGPALPGIVNVLKDIPYLHRVLIGLDAATQNDFERARGFFRALPQRADILWRDGERIQQLYRKLDEAGVFTGPPGKGRMVWIALGCVLADPHSRTVALHDADILTYRRDLLARLCYPVMNPSLSYEYAKGYYARLNDGRLYGRVARLFVTPLLRSLLKIVGYHPFLVFLDSFRYPLAGEFAMDEDLARVMRVPSDWGLEISLLAEVHRNLATRRVCEVDIADAYEHKHKSLELDWPQAGLFKMAVDIAKSLLCTLAQEGIEISEGFFRTVRATYLRMGQDQVRRFADDAAINHLQYDRHAEGTAVEIFAKAIEIAAKDVYDDPLGAPTIPQWARVTSALPDFLDELREAVDADNR